MRDAVNFQTASSLLRQLALRLIDPAPELVAEVVQQPVAERVVEHGADRELQERVRPGVGLCVPQAQLT